MSPDAELSPIVVGVGVPIAAIVSALLGYMLVALPSTKSGRIYTSVIGIGIAGVVAAFVKNPIAIASTSGFATGSAIIGARSIGED